MLEVGAPVVVRTPDRRHYYGRLLEIRGEEDNAQYVVRLDTGWVTSYPAHMVQPRDSSASPVSDS